MNKKELHNDNTSIDDKSLEDIINENYLTLDDMKVLLDNLRCCDNPFTCPHGRPTIITYSNYDLEKLFKRSGF